MMGQQVAQGALFYGFRLDDHVPADHLLKRIDGLLDFGFVRGALAASYSSTGRPSVDPELMLRMLLVGYLFGIRSERRLCEEVHLNLAYRWFCRLDLADRVPDHSTFSKNRHGRFRECDLHRLLFEEVVTRCAAAGLVAGREVAVDGSTIMADASREKKLKGTSAAEELRAGETVSRPVAEYLAALDAALPPNPDEPAPVEPLHVSPTDPQAALTCKHGPAQYAYAINPLLDLDTDCILDVEATPARFGAEVAATRTLVSRARTRLGIQPSSLAADKAYGSGPLLGWLIDRNITPYIPIIDRTRQRDGFFTRDAFRYDPETDTYRCPADKTLTYRGTVRASQVRAYRSRPADCAVCGLKEKCTTARQRAVTRLVTEDAREKVRALAGTDAYVRARGRRKRIERVFGHLKRNLKLRTLKLRGMAGATEEFTMAAAAYNLQVLARRAAPA
ncbi:transposase [Sphingomonas parapaucimobilis]|uniref:transposase n=1 Tax=Sphingomonas parapaucimobilis TaxID=28213 RepID=UPI0035C85C19